ncbi:ATP synthase F0 subunit A [Xylanimonas allomyrinae]|uniref:ATP synthase subunit a n=1 Tax=Xylanimonas allomyrinae TaxID=2509459 RepID=A0A4P6EKY3_9MICO|nr:F0F1 ATP synthase subunit A [Xylanimonas allomyrinae]QAY63274.1 ATP synthase F0 subunit A [Xylanimonas allomyrinae]
MTAWSDDVPTGCGPHRSIRSSGVILFTSLTPLLLAASDSDGGFHAPTIADFFPSAVLFAGTPFEINRIMLVRFIAAIALVLIVTLAARRAKVVPGRFQASVEFVLDFVRKQIAVEVLGEKLGRKYFPLLATIFCTVLFMNITGIVPFLNIAGSSVIGLPLVLALWVYVTYLWAGVKAHHGVGGFLKSSLLPPGVPWPLYFLLAPIEFLQVFVLRPATLAVRLLANMVAGHLMLAICFVATQYFFFTSDGGMKLFGAGTLFAGFLFFLFEAFVAALQAYVFAILAAVYINLSVEDH